MVVVNGVALPARLGVPEEAELAVGMPRAVLVEAVGHRLRAGEPVARLEGRSAGRGDELDRFTGLADQRGDTGTHGDVIGDLGRAALAVLALRLPPHAEACPCLGSHVSITAGLDHRHRHLHALRLEGGDVLDDHGLDPRPAHDWQLPEVAAQDAHPCLLAQSLEQAVPLLSDVVVEAVGVNLRAQPRGFFLDLADDPRLAGIGMEAVGTGNVDAQERAGVAAQQRVLLDQDRVAPRAPGLDGRAQTGHPTADYQHVAGKALLNSVRDLVTHAVTSLQRLRL